MIHETIVEHSWGRPDFRTAGNEQWTNIVDNGRRMFFLPYGYSLLLNVLFQNIRFVVRTGQSKKKKNSIRNMMFAAKNTGLPVVQPLSGRSNSEATRR